MTQLYVLHESASSIFDLWPKVVKFVLLWHSLTLSWISVYISDFTLRQQVRDRMFYDFFLRLVKNGFGQRKNTLIFETRIIHVNNLCVHLSNKRFVKWSNKLFILSYRGQVSDSRPLNRMRWAPSAQSSRTMTFLKPSVLWFSDTMDKSMFLEQSLKKNDTDPQKASFKSNSVFLL